MKPRTMISLLALMAILALAPSAVPGQGRLSSVLDLSGQGKFFDLPFPTELRRQGDGSIKTSDFPKILGLEMAARTKAAVEKGFGFSPAATVYFRFTGPVDASRLPSAKASLAADSPLFIIDVDPASPERGRRFPLIAKFYEKAPSYMSGYNFLLALMPAPGFVLRPNTLYAAGVLTALGDGRAQGQPLSASPTLAMIAQGQAPPGELGRRALELYRPALKNLADLGIQTAELAALTVFRVGDPTQRMLKLFDGVAAMPVITMASPLSKTREYPSYTVLQGSVAMPQFQDGTPAFGHGQGGRLQFDAVGKPVVQRMEPVAVALSIPKGKMPAEGFPIMIYVHGTGGTSLQFIERGQEPDLGHDESEGGVLKSSFHSPGKGAPPGSGPALILARRGIAGAGAAQPLSGERGGLSSQLTFYNFPSPEALRDNLLQACAEASMLLRLLEKIQIDPALCPGTDSGGAPIHFNPKLIFGMGQSLGSLILGPWGAVETDVKALIPSGNGAYWTLFMAEGNPIAVKSLRKHQKGFDTLTKLDLFHPLICLMGTVLAPADPAFFQSHYWKEPFPGRPPKNVWASFGLYDHYFYPVSQNAAIVSMALDFAGPFGEPTIQPALEIAGLKHLDYPVTANKQTPSGPVTAVALQYPMVRPLDGHHVNFMRNDAKYQYGCFLESLVKTGVPILYAPKDQWDAECGP